MVDTEILKGQRNKMSIVSQAIMDFCFFITLLRDSIKNSPAPGEVNMNLHFV